MDFDDMTFIASTDGGDDRKKAPPPTLLGSLGPFAFGLVTLIIVWILVIKPELDKQQANPPPPRPPLRIVW